MSDYSDEYAYQPVSDVDTVIEGYAINLRQIYDGRTAGDYTFVGVLASFLMHIDAIRGESS
jgi:hypothetical protein